MAKNTIGLILLMCVIAGTAMAASLELNIDLNGDGPPEKVRVQKSDSGYTLMVNESRIKLQDSDKTLLGIEGMDIDRKDGMQELRVNFEWDGGYGYSEIYAFDGRHIIKLAGITGSLKAPGSGKLYVDRWHGSFSTTARYQLSQRPPKLIETPQSLYYVGLKVKVKKSFPVRLRRHEPTSLIYVLPDSELSILAVDLDASECGQKQTGPCEFFLIRTSTNLTGWVERSQLEHNVQGLVFAG